MRNLAGGTRQKCTVQGGNNMSKERGWQAVLATSEHEESLRELWMVFSLLGYRAAHAPGTFYITQLISNTWRIDSSFSWGCFLHCHLLGSRVSQTIGLQHSFLPIVQGPAQIAAPFLKIPRPSNCLDSEYLQHWMSTTLYTDSSPGESPGAEVCVVQFWILWSPSKVLCNQKELSDYLLNK